MIERTQGRRDIVIGTAFAVFCLAILGWVLFASGQSSGAHRAEAELVSVKLTEERDERVAACQVLKSGSVASCIADAIGAEREAVRSEADLAAQRDMATWAFLLLGVSALTFVVSAVGLFALMATIREARNANEITRAAMVVQNRAWLKVSIAIASDVTLDPETNALSVAFAIKVVNVGQDPARDVHIRLRFASAVDLDLLQHQRALLRELDGVPDHALTPRTLMFAGEEKTFRHSVEDSKILAKVAEDFDEKLEELQLAPIGVVGCVRYRLIGSADFHHTCFAYEIGSRAFGENRTSIIVPDLPLSFMFAALHEMSHGQGEIC